MKKRRLDNAKQMRSVWDDLYDLYCHIEWRNIAHTTSAGDDCVYFPKRECDLIELKKIKEILGPKCEDYFRFLEFYNGMTLGQWLFFSTNDPNWSLMQFYDSEVILREDTNHNIEGKLLPIAIDNATHYGNKSIHNTANNVDTTLPGTRDYYLAKTGAVFSSLSWDSLLDDADLELKLIPISGSFEEFMRECVLGPRYPEFGKEDATYHFVQWYLKNQAQLDEQEFQKYGVCNDVDRNPTRDPRIVTSLREMGRDMARQTYEQTKGLPAGTKISFS